MNDSPRPPSRWIAQILVCLLTCAVLEVSLVLWEHKEFVWPASALLTGNGVALILRNTTGSGIVCSVCRASPDPMPPHLGEDAQGARRGDLGDVDYFVAQTWCLLRVVAHAPSRPRPHSNKSRA